MCQDVGPATPTTTSSRWPPSGRRLSHGGDDNLFGHSDADRHQVDGVNEGVEPRGDVGESYWSHERLNEVANE